MGHADRKKPVNFLQKPWNNLTEPLEQCSSTLFTKRQGLLEKVYGGGWEIMPEHMERCRFGNNVAESAHFIKISATWHLVKTLVEQEA